MPTTPDGYSTVGLRVLVGNGLTPETFDEVIQCVQPPTVMESGQLIDTTYTSASRRKRITGRIDAEPMSMKFNFHKGNAIQQRIIDNWLGSRVNQNWRITVANATDQVWGFNLAYSKVGVELDPEGQQVLVVEGTPSGDIDWNASI